MPGAAPVWATQDVSGRHLESLIGYPTTESQQMVQLVLKEQKLTEWEMNLYCSKERRMALLSLNKRRDWPWPSAWPNFRQALLSLLLAWTSSLGTVFSLLGPMWARILLSQFRHNPHPDIRSPPLPDHHGLPAARILLSRLSKNPTSLEFSIHWPPCSAHWL